MTEAEFLFIHDNAAGNINTPDTINVNFDLDPNNSEQGIITGITLTISDYDNEDLTTVLEQVEKVELTLKYFGEDLGIAELNQSNITLNIISRTKRLGFGFPYFYYKVTPTTISPINAVGTEFKFIPLSNPNQIPNANSSVVTLTPVLSGVKFLNDDYNPLLSNASKNRVSKFNQVSDREQLSLNPTNIEKLLAQTAEAAQIPDSNYTDTGLINARYDGSKLDSGSVVGDDPGLSFLRFGGSIHNDDADNATIAAISPQERVIEQIYFNFDNTKIISSSATESSFSSVPEVGHYLYNYDDNVNRYSRLVNSKIFNLESGAVITTDNAGLVIARSANLVIDPTPTPSPTISVTLTPSVTPSVTPSITVSTSVTPSISITPTPTPSPSDTS